LPASSPVLRVYRRIPYNRWEDDGRPKAGNFVLRQGIDQGLSVYQVARPRLTLEALLADQRAKISRATDPDERRKAERFLRTNGSTPEELVEKGWGIVALDVPRVIALGFTLGPVDPASGHLEIVGAAELFETCAEDFQAIAYRLSSPECLR
jgi:hypothetical protein